MTSLTYTTKALKDADRDRQRELLKALRASELALRLDECGAWRVNGKRGHIYTWADYGGGWVMYVACTSMWGWTTAKKRLAFAEVVQNGNEEGCVRLHELPTADQARVIRSILGIRKRKSASVAANLSRQKVLEVPTGGKKSTPEPGNNSGGCHPTVEAPNHDFGATVAGSQEEVPHQAGHRLGVGARP